MADDEGQPKFSVEQAMAAQRALRTALGKSAEQFPLPAFIGMLSDEIEELRAVGKTDDELAAIISDQTGKTVSAADLANHYALPERRQR